MVPPKYFKENGDVSTFKLPCFNGGKSKMYAYLASNLKYSKLARENGVKGKVLVRFVIKKDGSVADVEIIKSVSTLLNDEAIRLVSNMPKLDSW